MYNNNATQDMKDKVLGALYGFAIGDAMGATTEFMSADQIAAQGQVTEIVGGGWLNLKAGQVTDDTQMSMCVMEAIMDSGSIRQFKENTKQNFIKWYESNPPDVGGQCSLAIQKLMDGEVIKCNPYRKALGNGSLMRALPCALLARSGWNVIQGKLTHPDIECTRILLRYHDMIGNIIYNFADGAMDTADKLMEPTGCIINTYNNALFWSSQDSFEACIIGAVNHGGDSDTIAAISGSLSGARYGFKAIPEKWKFGLDTDVRTTLEKFAAFVVEPFEK